MSDGAPSRPEAGEDAEKAMFAEWEQAEAHTDLSDLRPDDAIVFVIFWALFVTVFLQFFTRYVLNDSAAWTEEIARYLLIATVFTGAAIGVAKNNHIQVDFFYRYMPHRMGRFMATVVDLLRIAFFSAAVVLTGLMMLRLKNARMTMIDLHMNWVYGVCLLGFAAMAVRSVLVMRTHLRRGYSVLERPMTEMHER